MQNSKQATTQRSADFFKQVGHHDVESYYLHECDREIVAPHLFIRLARVEDYEELASLVARAQSKYFNVAKLPDWCNPGQDFALARLVEKQDENNCVLVAFAQEKMVCDQAAP